MSQPSEAAGVAPGRAGRIERLPPDIREHVDRRIREGAYAREIVEETLEMLDIEGEAPLSESSVKRYRQKMAVVGSFIERANQAAQSMVRGLDESNSGNITRLVIDFLRAAMFESMVRAQDGESIQLDEKQISKLALALRRVEDAGRMNQAAEVALRKSIADEVKGVIGDNDPIADKIDRAIMGVTPDG